MRVGVVAYEMEGERSGVGRYLEGLLQGLVDIGDSSTWRLYFKGSPFEHPLWSDERRGESLDEPAIVPVFDHRPSARPIAWEQTRLPFRMRGDDLDLLFSPGYSLPPLVGVPAVLTLHDLSFEHLPSEFAWKERWRRRHLARLGVRRAARVLADTETIADDLVRTYDLPRDKVGVVPLAVDRRFFAPLDDVPDLDERLAALGVTRPYVLFVGSVLPRRRLDLALAAFRVLVDEEASRRPDLRFVLAGRDRLHHGSVDALVADLALGDRVVRLDYAPEELLPGLYARAEASLYLSSYEGYGLPPLESLAAGTPAVVAPGLALDDLVVDYAFRVERLEVDAVVATLRRALDDPKRARIVDDARAAVRRLSWARCALRLRRELERALEAR